YVSYFTLRIRAQVVSSALFRSASRRAEHFLLTSIVNCSWRVIFWTRPAQGRYLQGPTTSLPGEQGFGRSLRPRRRRAAEQRDKLAPFHCAIPPVRSTQRIAHVSYGGRLLRCRSQVESDAQARPSYGR